MVWALQRYVQVDIEGLEQSFFEEETQEPPTAPGEGTNQHNEPSQATDPANADASNTIPNNAEELHPLIQEILDQGGNNLDNDDIVSVMAAALMIDDDNQPAPENLLSTEDSTGATDDIMGQWTHSGICDRKATIQRNAKPELTFWTLSLSNPSNLNLFEGLFFSSFIKTTILPQTNQNLPHGEKTHLIWGIPTFDWFVDANGDYCQSTEARVLGNQPNRSISWGPSSSERLDDLNSIRGHPLSAYLH